MKFHNDAREIMRVFAGAPGDDVSPRRQLTYRLAASMRLIIERLVDTKAPDEDLRIVADDLESMAERLGQFQNGRVRPLPSEASLAAMEASPAGHADFSPVIGPANPLAAPMRLTLEDEDPENGKVVGRVTFGHAYEGPPGHVHGGFIAAAFDDLLGSAQALSGNPGMTGNLTVQYRSPTPLHVELRFEGTLERIDGRKIYTSGRLLHGDTLCAEAEALFISIDFAKMAAIAAKRK